MRTLRIVAGAEAASLALLFINLFTFHLKGVTSLVGPLHGTAYLITIGAACMLPAAAETGARWRAVIAGIGGLLALARINGLSAPEASRLTTTPGDSPG